MQLSYQRYTHSDDTDIGWPDSLPVAVSDDTDDVFDDGYDLKGIEPRWRAALAHVLPCKAVKEKREACRDSPGRWREAGPTDEAIRIRCTDGAMRCDSEQSA